MSLLTLPATRRYEALPPTWTAARLAPVQASYLGSAAQVNYVYAGRRSFKTRAAKLRLVRSAIATQKYPDSQYFACAPTHSQAKSIFWEDLKGLIPAWAFKKDSSASISESELRIELWNGALIRLAGLDRPQRVEGGFWDGGVVTEYAECRPDIFEPHIQPMMMRGGWIDLESVPEGRNHFYREIQDAKLRSKDPQFKDVYGVFHWKTADVLHLWLGRERANLEIAKAKASMDPRTYAQEYEADFMMNVGAAYYCFDPDKHIRHGLPYQPTADLIVALDFNIAPGVAVLLQEMGDVTHAIGEVWIPRGSNTVMVCNRIIKDWGKHQGQVKVYGDATGGAGGSAKVFGSDWDLVRKTLTGHFGSNRVKMIVPEHNPRERARVNAVNSRLRSTDGKVRFFLDGARCPKLARDLTDVQMVEGGSGEIDKGCDPELTHLTDALGYYLVRLRTVAMPEGRFTV